ncbi:DNA repair protein RecO [Stagnihabitans tardus]|uniref:DNA repair protein RecO n=1 Tax=Stagnihabitans tardus TaxID=2699202 RepID=A0AAE4YEJ0_9RHOB|nr:DNA repair protein RecO [Stagnihabitans tardus]NBZ88435.1 DNA repair protein RecO [Stagnihabitans tardus]
MDWQDDGILLTTRPHGESSAIVEVLTASHGRHMGVVRGGASRRMAGVLIPGTQLALRWRARLEDHMGSFTVEPKRSRAVILEDRGRLAALNSAVSLLHISLPERDPHPALYALSLGLFDQLAEGEEWLTHYIHWELALLDQIGYALDLGSCAVTGSNQDLAYVSPKTGRAVSREAAGDWAPRLLPLPRMLRPGANGASDPDAALDLTGHFLARALPDAPLPDARARLQAWVTRHISVAD